MRILHTSDWHLGASLEGALREDDHRAFLGWLEQTAEEESIDLLVIAGDVFDTPAPSAEAQSLYYGFLHRLQRTRVRQVVVVGGNHDSGARLDAPKELLGAMGVHVVGGLDGPSDIARCLCPVRDANGAVAAVVAAVPFVHEWRLGYRPGEGNPDGGQDSLGEPFRRVYAELADMAQAQWPGVPLVATGHLAVAGSERDDAPHEIHLIGTLGGLPTGIFDPRYSYVALGHIHRAYRVGGTNAWYCGSPIALNVKEGLRHRTVNLVDLAQDGTVTVSPINVPHLRRVVGFSGEIGAVQDQIGALRWDGDLVPMVKVELVVDAYEVGLEERLRGYLAGLDPRPLLVGLTQSPRQVAPQEGGVSVPQRRLAELDPRDVFRLLCETKGESLEELSAAFESLLSEEVQG